MGLVVQSIKPNEVVKRSTGSVNANNISKYTGFFLLKIVRMQKILTIFQQKNNSVFVILTFKTLMKC